MGILGPRRAPARAAVRRGATRSTGSSSASCACRATASTPRTANGSARSCSRRSAAASSTGRCSCRESVLVRVYYIVHCPTGLPDASTSPRSRRGSPRRPAPGPTTCARRWSPRTARSAARAVRAATSDAFPPALPRRLDGALGGRRHRPDRASSSAAARADHEPVPAAPRREVGTLRCKLFSADGVLALGRAADVRAHGGEGRRRAPVRDHAGGLADQLDLRLRPAMRRPRTSSASATSFQTRSSPCGAGELEDDGLNGLVLARRR